MWAACPAAAVLLVLLWMLLVVLATMMMWPKIQRAKVYVISTLLSILHPFLRASISLSIYR